MIPLPHDSRTALSLSLPLLPSSPSLLSLSFVSGIHNMNLLTVLLSDDDARWMGDRINT